jgi:methionyl aminopeptidase
MGYPATICASVNQEVVHGIPGTRVLNEGDIIGIDLGAIVEGYHGDSAMTFPIGKVSPEAERLMKATQESLYVGIKKARAGNRLSDIGHAIQRYAEKLGYSVVRDLVGHGIGSEMHEAPQIPNYGKPGRGPVLEPGMTLAIEPMINIGGPGVRVLRDGWTFVTRDGSLSAHFEHTVAITQGDPEILTTLPPQARDDETNSL